jgi:hypothetical protein
MLMRVWQELEYCIDVCHVTRGAYISSYQKKLFQFSVDVNSSIKVGFRVINICNHGVHYETPCIYKL